ncbi:response regulator [Haloarcula marina]|uniref:response regulator n=1 Tax=Haloarcula marina TaxID=2961574 RepID=UPI0020B85811|nr:response regulator [Halomicroarcula marina]
MGDEVGGATDRRSQRARSDEAVRVLLVDDEPDIADVTSLHLEKRRDRFDVTVVESGAEALETVAEDDVDCVVSDYEMPGMDGLALLRSVQDADPTIPFILYTGRGSEEIASDAISAGVTDYLQKRTTSEQYDVLANRIDNAVARRRSEQAREETELRYRTLVEASPHAILVHYGEDVVYANQRTVELLGVDAPTDIYRADALIYVHPDDRERVGARMAEAVSGQGDTGWLSWRLVRRDGEQRRVESRGTPVVYDGNPAAQVVIRDVTDQYRRERRLEALNEATRDLLTADSRTAVARTAVGVVSDVLDEPLAAVFDYVDGELRTLVATEAATDRVAISREATQSVRLGPETVEMTAFREGNPRVVDDYATRDDSPTDAFETVFLFPLGDHGLLSVASVEPDAFDGSDRDLLEIVGQSVVAAFDRLTEA